MPKVLIAVFSSSFREGHITQQIIPLRYDRGYDPVGVACRD
jgi:hypothetical protein